MTTWGQLKTLAQTFVHRSDIDWNALEPLCCADISLALTIQENESAATVVLSGPDANGLWSGPLPQGYAAIRAVRQSGVTLNPQDIKTLAEWGSWDYAISNMSLWTTGGADCQIVYTQRTLPIGTDAGTSDVLDRYPAIYLYALLKHAAIVIQDPEVKSEFYEQQFLAAVQTANSLYLDAAFGPGSMAIPMGGAI